MLKWIKKLFKGKQTQVVGNNSFAIQVGRDCNITNSFNGRNIKTTGNLSILNDEVWVDGKKINKGDKNV